MDLSGFAISVIIIGSLVIFFGICIRCGDYIQGEVDEHQPLQ